MLFDAFKTLLTVGDSPTLATRRLYLMQLPSDQVDAVDVACVLESGIDVQRKLGRDVVDYWKDVTRFDVRGTDARAVVEVADAIRDAVVIEGEREVSIGDGGSYRIVRCAPTSLRYERQDPRGRMIVSVEAETWHSPA